MEATNVYCSTCMQLEMANCSRFVAPELPPTPHLRLPDSLFLSEPSVRKMSCGVPSSGRAKRALIMTSLFESTSTVTDDTESRKQLQCSAKARKCHESPSRQLKNEGEKFFPRFARTDWRFTPPFTPFGSGRTTPKYLAPALINVILPRNLSGCHMTMFCSLTRTYPAEIHRTFFSLQKKELL